MADVIDERAVVDDGPRAGSRIERLRERASGTARRLGGREADRGAARVDRVLSVTGLVLIPLGVIAVAWGWYGAARTPFVFEQIPYLISGGLLGIGLLFAGGLLYVGSWLSRLAQEQRDEGEKVRELIAGLRADLRGVPASAVAAFSGVEQVEGRANPTMYWATPTGTMFHARECAVVADRDDVRRVEAGAGGMEPCKMCAPLGS